MLKTLMIFVAGASLMAIVTIISLERLEYKNTQAEMQQTIQPAIPEQIDPDQAAKTIQATRKAEEAEEQAADVKKRLERLEQLEHFELLKRLRS